MLGIIGGTGFNQLPELSLLQSDWVDTPYGTPSSAIQQARWCEQDIAFLARHGQPHTIPPHKINYRANIWALQKMGVSHIVAIAAVGGISVAEGALVLPDQIVDYTYGREHTYYDGNPDAEFKLEHIDFSLPYCGILRGQLIGSATQSGIELIENGCYGATQGPRLESAAEIQRMQRDGCSIVGMTGMPEASLAKELGMSYACIAVVVNPAAGLSQQAITLESMQHVLKQGTKQVATLIGQLLVGNNF